MLFHLERNSIMEEIQNWRKQKMKYTKKLIRIWKKTPQDVRREFDIEGGLKIASIRI